MADEPKNPSGSNINISGSVSGANVNIGGTQNNYGSVTIHMRDMTQTIAKSNAAPSDKEQLQTLVDQLKAALASVPAEQKDAAQLVADRTDEAVKELSRSQIDKEDVTTSANRLKKAAENLKDAMPIVVGIATSIVAQVLKMGGIG